MRAAEPLAAIKAAGDHADWTRTRQWERSQEQAEARNALTERYQRDIYMHGPDLAEALRLHATDDLGEELRKLAHRSHATSEDPLAGLKEALSEIVNAYAQELADDDLREDD